MKQITKGQLGLRQHSCLLDWVKKRSLFINIVGAALRGRPPSTVTHLCRNLVRNATWGAHRGTPLQCWSAGEPIMPEFPLSQLKEKT
jgi:hypothetical protein